MAAGTSTVILARGSEASLAVIRTFEFTAALRRMSVIVKREGSVDAQVYCKGAPESIASLCEASSLPSDYNAVLDRCTRAGFRVLAVAGKTIDAIGWQGAQTLTREQAENELQLLGLIVFENKLKAATTSSIATIREDAQLPIKMCTGDSVLTAVSVGKECGMLSANAEVFTPRLAKQASEKSSSLVEWISIDDEHSKLDPYTLDPIMHGDAASSSSRKLKDVDLAVSGEILRTWLIVALPKLWLVLSSTARSLAASHLSRSKSSLRGCRHLVTSLHSQVMVQTTVVPSNQLMLVCLYPRQRLL